MAGFVEAFDLRDNPFRLENSLPADIKPQLRTSLITGPLRMAEEKRLVDYYCDCVYSATDRFFPGFTPFQRFRQTMEGWKYSNENRSVDDLNRSIIILIRGHKGTGKTSLAHRMVRWLLECDQGGYWKAPVFHDLDDENDSVADQVKSLDDTFRTGITKAGDANLLCLVNDVVKGAEVRLFKMFNDLQKNRTLFLFITSSDREIQSKDYTTRYPPVICYDTKPLTPDGAIEYCKARMKPLRSDPPPAWLSTFPLFPFFEEQVKACLVAPGGPVSAEPGAIALTQFNVRFSRAMERELLRLPKDFRINALPVDEIRKYLIDPSDPDIHDKVA